LDARLLTQHEGNDFMIANPIVQPKMAILASLLVGALTIVVFASRPGPGGDAPDSSGFRHGDTSSAGAPDHPRPTALASGKVAAQNQSDAHVAQVLDAVRASLKRDDLASARVLLGALSAEQAIYRDDPRVMALHKELQAREGGSGQAPGVESSSASAASSLPAASRSERIASRYAAMNGHGHSAASRNRERIGSFPEYSASAHMQQTEAVTGSASTRGMPNPAQANPDMNLASLRAAPVQAPVTAAAAVAGTASAVSSSAPSLSAQSGVLPAPPVSPVTPVSQNGQSVQGVAAVQSAQAVSTWTPPSSNATQEPKTRAQVRMEVDQARSDGALPRFGNPDPAGPGGAPSRVTHPVVINW
jgi:hypothetical protein